MFCTMVYTMVCTASHLERQACELRGPHRRAQVTGMQRQGREVHGEVTGTVESCGVGRRNGRQNHAWRR